jgi:hypothetical protein
MIQVLPCNWAARISEVNKPGEKYYFHLITNQSQWDFPEEKSTKEVLAKEVLVLCQRKEGLFGDKSDLKKNLRETVVPELTKIIETFLKEIIGSSISNIKYMRPYDPIINPHDKADFNMELTTKRQTKEMKDFFDNHLNFYDLIVLQTCPGPWMDYKAIAHILKKDGYVVCTAIQNSGFHTEISESMKNIYIKNFESINFFQVPDTKDLTFQYKEDKKYDLWPMEKMHKMYERYSKPDSKGYAVVLTTGAMNPVHLGHVDLIDQSVIRLTEEGYTVIGAWMSPSHDLYVQPKARKNGTIGLSAPFRVKLARLIISGDPLIDVSSWESSLKISDWVDSDYPKVCSALKMKMKDEFKSSKYSGNITVFYACGSDHAKKAGLYNHAQSWGGVVVVPRENEKVEPENDAFKLYIANPATGEHAGYSSTILREAIAKNKRHIVDTMMSSPTKNFLFDPTYEDSVFFKEDFDKLKKLQNM